MVSYYLHAVAHWLRETNRAFWRRRRPSSGDQQAISKSILYYIVILRKVFPVLKVSPLHSDYWTFASQFKSFLSPPGFYEYNNLDFHIKTKNLIILAGSCRQMTSSCKCAICDLKFTYPFPLPLPPYQWTGTTQNSLWTDKRQKMMFYLVWWLLPDRPKGGTMHNSDPGW